MKNIARILLSCLFLLTGARLLPAQTPPAAVPAVSELDPAPANLALKKSLDLRHADLQKRFDDWTKAATKFNNDFGGRKYKEKSKEAKDALKEQNRIAGLLALYEPDAAKFNADVAKLVRKKPGAAAGIDLDGITVQEGVENAAQLRRDLLSDFSVRISDRTATPNEQAREILGAIAGENKPAPVKNIEKLAAGDVILVAPYTADDHKKAGAWNFGVSNGINLLDRWGSNNWSSPASHAAVYLGEKNGKRWYFDNTGKGPVILEEGKFLQDYGVRNMDVATLVGQPLSMHEGEEIWKGAHELRNTMSYGPSQFMNWGPDYAMVCSESSRWLLVRAGRRVPETASPDAKVAGLDSGLNKNQFVKFSPSDFYTTTQYFVIHRLDVNKGDQP